MKLYFYIRRFWKLPWVEIKLLIKGFSLCLLLIVLVNIIPFKYYLGLLRKRKALLHINEEKESIIKLVQKTIKRIERLSPINFSCLVKSCIIKILLNSYGIDNSLKLGVAVKSQQLLIAHAYVKVEDYFIYLNKKKMHEVFSID
ncbi:MAG: lasso peptide biosynthesis B2 protein [Bacteroidales bacterium]|nr:lasso peptide biosynthesis B2 protein [Bacteroidales bacterium]